MSSLDDFNLDIRKRYEAGSSLSDIAKIVGLSSAAVRNRLIAMDVERRKRGGSNNVLTRLDKMLNNPIGREKVLEILLDSNLSTVDKADRLQLHPSTIRQYIKTLIQEANDGKASTVS